jgi:hypothetical protein
LSVAKIRLALRSYTSLTNKEKLLPLMSQQQVPLPNLMEHLMTVLQLSLKRMGKPRQAKTLRMRHLVYYDVVPIGQMTANANERRRPVKTRKKKSNRSFHQKK